MLFYYEILNAAKLQMFIVIVFQVRAGATQGGDYHPLDLIQQLSLFRLEMQKVGIRVYRYPSNNLNTLYKEVMVFCFYKHHTRCYEIHKRANSMSS